jgi:hypothetical protein
MSNTQGASQLSAKRIRLLEIAHTPQSSGLAEGLVACFVTTANDIDDLAVDIPTSASAIDSGRAFAGVVMDYSSAVVAQDSSVLLQVAGVAKCKLKANSTVTRGQGIGYDPADGGTVQPITAANAGRLVRIGTSRQSKVSNASIIMLSVLLDGRDSDMSARSLSVITAASTAITNTTSETAFSTTFAIPANRLRVGSVLRLRARASVSSGNSTDTLTLRARLTNAAGTLLGEGPAVDVTNGGGDVGDIDLEMIVRTLGGGGTMMTNGKIGLLTAVQATGSVGAVTIDTTAAITLVITAQWSAASASNSVAMDGGSLQIVG